MPDTDTDRSLLPAQLGAALAALVHGPYADEDTAGVAGLAAEAVRYLNHAVPRGGVAVPATVADVASDLSTMACRLPQLLAALSGCCRTLKMSMTASLTMSI
ncbi:MAG TPA: hypothetical protein VFE59_24660 [Trebonia sp.]|jgi:hypothetical protein|nr:hypothetical protein [Trebonia sp.]